MRYKEKRKMMRYVREVEDKKRKEGKKKKEKKKEGKKIGKKKR
jgi:hypothetical protein